MNQLNLSFLLDFVKEWFTIVNTKLARKFENKRLALTTQTMEEKLRDKKYYYTPLWCNFGSKITETLSLVESINFFHWESVLYCEIKIFRCILGYGKMKTEASR